MQIRCPRCRSTYEAEPGKPAACPACAGAAQAVTQVESPAAAPAPTAEPSPAKSRAPAPDPAVGKVVGGYRILSRLGRGGMSTVYKAVQVSLDRFVALKIPHDDFIRDERFRARFDREARTLAKLDHPNIVQIIDVGTAAGRYYIAMEYVEGTTLGRYLAQRGPLPLPAGAVLLKKCCAALARAHEAKIVHRDIKPDNILLTVGGQPKLTDFGLAKPLDAASTLSLTGTILGTPLYMSPEQADGADVDARSDLYSLGATFYHALTGRPPFEGATAVTIVLKHTKEPLKPAHQMNASIPAGLSDVLTRMLAKKPEDRFPSAEAVIAAIEAWEQGKAPTARPAAPPPWKRKPLVIGASAAAAVLVALVAYASLGSRSFTPPENPPPAPPAAAKGPAKTAVPAPTPPPPPAPGSAKPPEAKPANPAPTDPLITLEEIEEFMGGGPPGGRPPDGGPRRMGGGGGGPPPDAMRGRRERAEGIFAALRDIPREPEPGTREALRIARDSLAKDQPMIAATALQTTRSRFAGYIDSHPELKSEYDKLTQDAFSKLPLGVRRQFEEGRGRMGRGPGF
jgi:serine/threonine protein kinase